MIAIIQTILAGVLQLPLVVHTGQTEKSTERIHKQEEPGIWVRGGATFVFPSFSKSPYFQAYGSNSPPEGFQQQSKSILLVLLATQISCRNNWWNHDRLILYYEKNPHRAKARSCLLFLQEYRAQQASKQLLGNYSVVSMTIRCWCTEKMQRSSRPRVNSVAQRIA